MKRTVLAFTLLLAAAPLSAQDMPLSQVLVEDAGWELVADGYGFTDACTADAEGNFYFSDVKGGEGVYRIDPEGKITLWLRDLPGLSGMQFGPDGKLYACQGRLQRLIRITPGKDGASEVEVLVERVRPNDLVVTHEGAVYFTHTGPSKIEYVSPSGEHRTVSQGIVGKPNGITLSPQQGTLIVSDHGGRNAWAFRIEDDGSLSHPSPYMNVRTPAGTEVSKGDGSTTDAYGRYYVTADKGLHMYDPTGRLGGVIANPAPKAVSVEFAGPGLSWLYIAADGKIFRRQTKSTGLLFQNGPDAIRSVEK